METPPRQGSEARVRPPWYTGGMTVTHIRGPLTRELDNPSSPIRAFLDARFTPGLKAVQKRYRTTSLKLAVPGGEANAGTIGTAADWLFIDQ